MSNKIKHLVSRFKKGFTLIELLAVIVVLSLLALIGYILVGNVIQTSQESVDKMAMNNFAKAIKEEYLLGLLTENEGGVPILKVDTSITDNTKNNVIYIENGVSKEGIKSNLISKYRGDKIVCGLAHISHLGEVTLGECIFEKDAEISSNGELIISKNESINIWSYEGDKVVKIVSENSSLANRTFNVGDILYFNPETGKICKNYDSANSNSGHKSGCMKWYVYKDTTNSVSLLLDHNIMENRVWELVGNGYYGFDFNFETYLSNWKREIRNTARPMTIKELKAIIGKGSVVSGSEYISASNYKWLIDDSKSYWLSSMYGWAGGNGCTCNGVNVAYTVEKYGSSIRINPSYEEEQKGLPVNCSQLTNNIINSGKNGVRPVIEVSKKTESIIVNNISVGTVVYFNPTTGLKCSDYVSSNSNTNHVTGCLRWRAFDVTETTVKLLLDHNAPVYHSSLPWQNTVYNTRSMSRTEINKIIGKNLQGSKIDAYSCYDISDITWLFDGLSSTVQNYNLDDFEFGGNISYDGKICITYGEGSRPVITVPISKFSN